MNQADFVLYSSGDSLTRLFQWLHPGSCMVVARGRCVYSNWVGFYGIISMQIAFIS